MVDRCQRNPVPVFNPDTERKNHDICNTITLDVFRIIFRDYVLPVRKDKNIYDPGKGLFSYTYYYINLLVRLRLSHCTP